MGNNISISNGPNEVLKQEWHDETFDCDDEEKTKQLREVEEEVRLRLDPYPKPLGSEEADDEDGQDDEAVQNAAFAFVTPMERGAEDHDNEEEKEGANEEAINDVDEVGDILEQMDEEPQDVRPDLPAIFAAVLDGYHCCADNCLNAFTREFLEKTLGGMAKLTQHARCKMLYSVAAFGLAPDSEKEAERKRKRRAKAAGNIADFADAAVEMAPAVAPAVQCRSQYYLMGKPVCRQAVCRLHGVSVNALKTAIRKVGIGVIVPQNSLRGKHRLNTHFARTDAVILFLNKLAEDEGYPDPCGRGSKRDKPVTYLPAGWTKVSIYRTMYLALMVELEIAHVSYNHFVWAWTRRLPTIRIRMPKTDICDTCANLRKTSELQLHQQHLAQAHVQRCAFKAWVAESRTPAGSHAVVLTFDYAEKILLPLFTDTPKSMFYTVGLKVDLFGVGNNTDLLQHNYVLPEGHWPADKSLNSVGSMLYHNITTHHVDKTTLLFMADNCSGQNKNMYMMWFLSYVSIVHPGFALICLRFLVAGHTKNFCDACFGMCKRSLKGQDVITPRDVTRLYETSSKCNLVERTDTGVVWYDWKEFLAQFYKGVVPHIFSMHEFEFRTASPGIVFYKDKANSAEWMQQPLLRPGLTAADITGTEGTFRPLSDFIVDPATYAPMDKIVKKEPDMTRRQYLHIQVMDQMLVGNLAEHRNYFFGAGGPVQGEPPVVDPLPPTTAAANRKATAEAAAALNLPVSEQPGTMTRKRTAAHNKAFTEAEERRKAERKIAAAAKKKKKEDEAQAAKNLTPESAAQPSTLAIGSSTLGLGSPGPRLFFSPGRGSPGQVRGGRINERERYASPGTPSPGNV